MLATMVKHLLFCWIGITDLKAASGNTDVGMGPIAQAITNRFYDEAVLLNNWEESAAKDYCSWLQQKTSSSIIIRQVRLSSPTHFGEIYQAATTIISKIINKLIP
jgi:hypothetical protein